MRMGSLFFPVLIHGSTIRDEAYPPGAALRICAGEAPRS